MKTVNKATLLGNVGRDPEVKTLGSGTTVASFSIATNYRFKDKAGQWSESADFHNCAAYGRTAEIVRDYVRKGSQIYVEGRIQTRSWEKDGQKQYRTEIVVSELVLLGGKQEKQETGRDWVTVPDSDPTEAQDDDIPF